MFAELNNLKFKIFLIPRYNNETPCPSPREINGPGVRFNPLDLRSPPTFMKLFATFSSLYIATLFMLFGNGLLTTYLALDLGQKEVSELLISSLTTAYYAGLVIGAKFGHKLIARVGHIRSYVAASGVTAAAVLMIALIDYIPFWIAIRFITGLVMMCQYMVIESWLNDQAEPENRGRVFAFYMAATYLGMMLGQLVFLLFDTIDVRILMIVSIFFSLCLIPLAVTRAIHPTPLKAAPLQIFHFIRQIPQVLIITAVAGMLTGSFYGLGPLFASRMELGTQEAGVYMALCIGAAFIIQWPLGYLSDRVNRLRLITFISVLIAGLTLAMNLPILHIPLPVYLILFLGIVAASLLFTLYPLSVAIANDNVSAEKRVSLSAILLVLFGIGAGIGPLIASYFMQRFGGTGLYLFFFFGAFSVIGLNLLKASRRLEKAPEEALPHVIMPDGHTSPISAALDPRIDEDTVKEYMENEEAQQIKEVLLGEIEEAQIEKEKRKPERYPLVPIAEAYRYDQFVKSVIEASRLDELPENDQYLNVK